MSAKRQDRTWLPWLAAILALLPCAPAIAGVAVPEIAKGRDAVILEESLEVDIRTLTDAREKYATRILVLTQRGIEPFDSASVIYFPGSVVRKIEGSVTLPSGRVIRPGRKSVVDGPALASFELYSDIRHRTLHFTGLVPGATVEYSWEKTVSNLRDLDARLQLADAVPAVLRTMTVRQPAGVPLWIAPSAPPVEYTRQEESGVTVHRWVVRDSGVTRRESHGPPPADLFPAIEVEPKLIEWSGRSINASSWDGIAGFYREIAQERMAPTPDVSSTALELATGASDDQEKIRRVFEFVQQKINYVAISLGIGGYQPHASGQTLAHRYGDCKDKATLMIAMMRALGLTGLPVLIRTRDSGTLDPAQPVLAFNHAIVAIPSEDGYMFLDPTATSTPFGDVPWQDQGATALVVGRDGRGELLTTPLVPPGRNMRRIEMTGTISGSGLLDGSLTVETSGQRAAALAWLLDAASADREAEVTSLVGGLLPGASIRSQTVARRTTGGGGMDIAVDFTVLRFTASAGALEVASPHRVGPSEIASLSVPPGRKQPVFFRHLYTDQVVGRFTLPQGRRVRKLPENRRLDGPGLSAEIRYGTSKDQQREVLEVERTVSVTRREIPASEFPALRQFIKALADEEARGIAIEPEG